MAEVNAERRKQKEITDLGSALLMAIVCDDCILIVVLRITAQQSTTRLHQGEACCAPSKTLLRYIEHKIFEVALSKFDIERAGGKATEGREGRT